MFLDTQGESRLDPVRVSLPGPLLKEQVKHHRNANEQRHVASTSLGELIKF
jgi:hypothetical protein